MKKILCYMGIIILFCLVLFPSILRYTLPDKSVEEKKINRSSYILSCSNTRFTINTSYEDEKIKMIVIKKIYTKEEMDKREQLDENVDNLDEQLVDSNNKVKYQDIVDIFEDIKDKVTINHNIVDDGEVISIDYSVNDHKELEIDKISQEMEAQQSYYEKLDFSCTVR